MSTRAMVGSIRVGVAVSLAIAGLGLTSATPASAAWLSTEKQLTTNSYFKTAPEISGTKVAYSDYRNEHDVGDVDDPDTLYDVRVLDLKTGKDRLITPKHDAYGDPRISGNIVVWSDYHGRMWYHNLATGTHKKVPVIGYNYEIDGNRICYDRSGRVYVYDLKKKKETALSPKTMDSGACHIKGSIVVWESYTSANNYDIQAYNLSTKKRTALTNSTGAQQEARTDGTWVVWVDEATDFFGDVYAYNLLTHVKRLILPSTQEQWQPDISGGRIVLLNNPDPLHQTIAQAYLYDLTTGVDTAITAANPSDYVNDLRISGSRIVYSSDRLGQRQFFLRTIISPTVKASAPKKVAKGSTPTINGTLKMGTTGIAGKNVLLEYSTNNKTWKTGASVVTALSGAFSITGPVITKTTWVRVRFTGTMDFAPAVSAKLKVTKA